MKHISLAYCSPVFTGCFLSLMCVQLLLSWSQVFSYRNSSIRECTMWSTILYITNSVQLGNLVLFVCIDMQLSLSWDHATNSLTLTQWPEAHNQLFLLAIVTNNITDQNPAVRVTTQFKCITWKSGHWVVDVIPIICADSRIITEKLIACYSPWIHV